jgi:hypothetical protein
MRPNLLEKSPTIHTIIVLVQYPCQIEGSTHSCNFILVETCTYLISTSYGGFITLHVRMSLPRSHRTGYHRLFSSMGQGGMLVSPYVSKTSLDPCCPNPLNMCIWIIIPGHPNPLSPCNHMWHMFIWRGHVIACPLWHVTLVFFKFFWQGLWGMARWRPHRNHHHLQVFLYISVDVHWPPIMAWGEVSKVLVHTKCQVILQVVGFLRPLLYAIIGGQWWIYK